MKDIEIIKLDNKMEKCLNKLEKITGKSKELCVINALNCYIDELEDLHLSEDNLNIDKLNQSDFWENISKKVTKVIK